jgi:hypothetical protein
MCRYYCSILTKRLMKTVKSAVIMCNSAEHYYNKPLSVTTVSILKLRPSEIFCTAHVYFFSIISHCKIVTAQSKFQF